MEKYYIITGIQREGGGLPELVWGDPNLFDVKSELSCLQDDWQWTRLRKHSLPNDSEATIQAKVADLRAKTISSTAH